MGETLDGLALRMWTEDALAEEERLPAPRSLDEIARDPQVAEALRHGAAFAIVPLLIETGRSAKANLSMGVWSFAAIAEAVAARGLTRSAVLSSAARSFRAVIGTNIDIDDGNCPTNGQSEPAVCSSHNRIASSKMLLVSLPLLCLQRVKARISRQRRKQHPSSGCWRRKRIDDFDSLYHLSAV